MEGFVHKSRKTIRFWGTEGGRGVNKKKKRQTISIILGSAFSTSLKVTIPEFARLVTFPTPRFSICFRRCWEFSQSLFFTHRVSSTDHRRASAHFSLFSIMPVREKKESLGTKKTTWQPSRGLTATDSERNRRNPLHFLIQVKIVDFHVSQEALYFCVCGGISRKQDKKNKSTFRYLKKNIDFHGHSADSPFQGESDVLFSFLVVHRVQDTLVSSLKPELGKLLRVRNNFDLEEAIKVNQAVLKEENDKNLRSLQGSHYLAAQRSSPWSGIWCKTWPLWPPSLSRQKNCLFYSHEQQPTGKESEVNRSIWESLGLPPWKWACGHVGM